MTTKPRAKFRAGQASCAIWENEAVMNGKTVTMLKASVERRYRDSSGTWKSSTSFSRNEIPLAVYCLEKAFEYMIEERSIDDEGEGTAPSPFVGRP